MPDNQESRDLKAASGRLLSSSAAEPPEIVYHYTSLDTAIKILNSFEMWCTNVSFSNDPSEGAHGQNVIDEVCTRDKDLLMRGARKLVAEEIDGYAASFCAKRDELTQWRSYSSDGHGVAIGIDTEVLSKRTNVLFTHIEYDRGRQDALVGKLLDLFRARMRSAQSRPPRLHQLGYVLTLGFVIVRGMFKDPSYYSEQEYRLLDALPKNPKHHNTTLEHFQRGVRSVPFFRVDLRDSTGRRAAQPIREVVVGPCLDFAAAEAALRQTAAYAAEPYAITRSSVPMRCD